MVDVVIMSIRSGGRFIYIGVGMSGWLGILDVVECRFMFSVFDSLVVGVIVGGESVI